MPVWRQRKHHRCWIINTFVTKKTSNTSMLMIKDEDNVRVKTNFNKKMWFSLSIKYIIKICLWRIKTQIWFKWQDWMNYDVLSMNWQCSCLRSTLVYFSFCLLCAVEKIKTKALCQSILSLTHSGALSELSAVQWFFIWKPKTHLT